MTNTSIPIYKVRGKKRQNLRSHRDNLQRRLKLDTWAIDFGDESESGFKNVVSDVRKNLEYRIDKINKVLYEEVS